MAFDHMREDLPMVPIPGDPRRPWRMPRTAVLESRQRSSSQAVTHFFDPLFRRHAVGPELLQPVLLLAGEEGAVATQLAGGGRVEQTAGVGRAHLEEHAHFELANCWFVK